MKITQSQLKRIIKEELEQFMDQPHVHVHSADCGCGGGDWGEGSMARNQLGRTEELAKMIQNLIQDDTNLDEWVEAKITMAEDYLTTVLDYLRGEELSEEQMSAKEKKFAALAPPKDKITYADKIAGAKKSIKEGVEQIPGLDELSTEAFRKVAKRAHDRLENLHHYGGSQAAGKAITTAIENLKFASTKGSPKNDANLLVGNAQLLASTAAYYKHLYDYPSDRNGATKQMRAAEAKERKNISNDVKELSPASPDRQDEAKRMKHQIKGKK